MNTIGNLQVQDMKYLLGAAKCILGIDDEVEKFDDLIEKADMAQDNRDTILNAYNKFFGVATFIVSAIILLIFNIAFSKINLALLIIQTILSLIITVILTLTIKNDLFKRLKNKYDKKIKEHMNGAERSFLAIKSEEQNYNFFCADIPQSLLNLLAIEIMYESIKQGYCRSLDEAIIFYKKRRDIMREYNDSDVQLLLKNIIKQEKRAEKRKVFFLKHKTKKPYHIV